MRRAVIAALVFLVALGLRPESGRAGLLTATDFDTLTLGVQVVPQIVTNFMTTDLTGQGGSASHAIGTLTGSVWLHDSVYTYALVVDPSSGSPSQFAAGYTMVGFTPGADQIGWSYHDATGAGVVGPPSSAFWVVDSSDGHGNWYVQFLQLMTGFWSGAHGTPLTFFLQSSLGPGFGRYDLTTDQVGSAMSYAPALPVPTPEPSTLVLLGSATTIIGTFVVRHGRRAKALRDRIGG